MKTLLCFCFLLLCLRLQAQHSSYKIHGTIQTKESLPIEFGNIIALKTDSSIITGAPFMDGKFNLPNLKSDTIILKFTSFTFTDYYFPFTRTNADTNFLIGPIILQQGKDLKEVTITAKTPMFEMDGEMVKVNVESSSLTNVGNALDVLKRSPGVQVNSSDLVSVFGKGTAIIYLDGLLVSSVELLKSLPSTDIKSIEIIQNPSARYDAGGRAVINIKTIKNNLEGYNGVLTQNTRYIKALFMYSGTRFNYTKHKWTTTLGAGLNKGEQWNSDLYERHYSKKDSTRLNMTNTIYAKQKFTDAYYYLAGVNYRPDSLTVVGLQYNGFYTSYNNYSENTNSILANNISQYNLHTFTNSRPVNQNNACNANFIRKLDTLGSELFMAAQAGKFNLTNTNHIAQETNSSNGLFYSNRRNINQNSINILGAQADLSLHLNKLFRLDGGIKETYISKSSTLTFENYNTSGQWIPDPSYLNGFSFAENIMAAYSELRFKKNKLNSRAGIRAEHTHSDGYSKTLNKNIINRQYLNFFPSAYVGYDFTKDLTTSLTYSTRINRPTFQDLDPFVNYIDSVTSFRGNPYLLPQYTTSLEAALVYMKEASLTFGYNSTNGALSLVVQKLNDSTDAFTATTQNLKNSKTYSAGITIPYEFSWWTTSNYFGYFLNNFTYTQNGILIKNYKPTFSIYLYNEFRANKIASLEITYEYTSSAVDGIFNSQPFSMLSATLKKTFFNKKLTCRFTASDILKGYIMRGNSNIPLYNIYYESRTSTHFYMLALNYRFGKLKQNDYRNRSISQDEYNRVKMEK